MLQIYNLNLRYSTQFRALAVVPFRRHTRQANTQGNIDGQKQAIQLLAALDILEVLLGDGCFALQARFHLRIMNMPLRLFEQYKCK